MPTVNPSLFAVRLADAKAAEIYAGAFNKNPEFYAFVRSLHAYKTALPISQIS